MGHSQGHLGSEPHKAHKAKDIFLDNQQEFTEKCITSLAFSVSYAVPKPMSTQFTTSQVNMRNTPTF